LVETVGVGQSEVAVANMTDVFLLLQLPNAGDDLQAMKKGVMEFADFVAINKCDLDAEAATRAQASMLSTLRLMESSRWVHPGVTDTQASMASMASQGGEGMGDLDPRGGAIDPALDTQAKPPAQHGSAHPVLEPFPIEARVHQLSALKGEGVQGLMDALFAHRQWSQGQALWAPKRQAQSRAWLWERVYSGLKSSFLDSLAVKNELPQVLVDVERGVLAPSTAARRLLGLFRGDDATRAFDAGSPP
jgi:LAO/AO transport system kinase